LCYLNYKIITVNCIIVDDEPLAREAIQMLIAQTDNLNLVGSFNSPDAATEFLADGTADLIFLDIQMPGINGIEFARTIPRETFVIFTTAFSEFATDSYEVDAIDYLIKPIRLERFQRGVEKAQTYLKLLKADYSNNNIETIADDYFFVKADRKIFKVYFDNILFIEGLKDYVVMHTESQKVITAMNIKTIHEQLPKNMFVRVSKSYIINAKHIESVDNNTVYIGKNEIPIGNIYRDFFFSEFVTKKILSR
jgi:DNA-binding LytR/AlgR family response regulator